MEYFDETIAMSMRSRWCVSTKKKKKKKMPSLSKFELFPFE